MRIVVTGSTGHLGRLVVEELLARGIPASSIVATGRSIERVADLAGRGVITRRADYEDPASLDEAFRGADRLLLVSSTDVGARVGQHRNVVEAALRAGVGLLAYTSIANAPTSSMKLVAAHRETEGMIRDSGLPHVFLRNSWYIENYTSQIGLYLRRGVLGATGDGKVSAATRADYAAATAATLADPGHAGRAYELGGAPFSLGELALELSRRTGREIRHVDMSVPEYERVLLDDGLPPLVAEYYADADRGLREGELLVAGDDLATLIGRAPTTLHEALDAIDWPSVVGAATADAP